MAKFGKLIVERKTDAEVRAEKQKHIDMIRRGGFSKTASREQAKLDRKK
jgi:ketol-acid reductoisomerase